MRALSLLYFGFLNFLLFAQVPFGLFPGASEDALSHYSPAFHLLSFTMLAVLVLGAGWPVARTTLVALLIAYGAGTELVQGLIPYRSCELSDCLNDLAGIAAGTAMLWPPGLPLTAALANSQAT
jgi:VanZ family protein